MSALWGIVHESGAWYDYAAKEPHGPESQARSFPSEAVARRIAALLTAIAGRGSYYARAIAATPDRGAA